MGEPQGYRKALILIPATFLFVGYLPLIPGTFGSLAGLLIYYLVRGYPGCYLSALFLVTLLGLLTTGSLERLLGRKDPGCVVIDEVAGMLLAFIFVPADIRLIAFGFVIFRIFDTIKPFPAGALQRLEKGSLGIMGDDLVAAVYTNIVLQVLARLISFKGS